jgi:hypothetical protein
VRAQSVICSFVRTVVVAGGVFAPGHLGELTQLAPFDLVDDVLAATGSVQVRVRDLRQTLDNRRRPRVGGSAAVHDQRRRA